MSHIVRSACRGCHGVCQVQVHLDGDRVVKVTGDRESPTSRGYICPKGAAAPELLYHPDRLTHPLRRRGARGDNRWERISWDDALGEMAERLDAVRRESGSEYFGMMQGTGRPYTGFASRFAYAFGTPNFTNVAHVCYYPRWMASVFTVGRLPVADLYGFGRETPRCIIIWGCNVTEAGASDGMCGGTVRRALEKAERVIVVDPRRIGPAAAGTWLPLRPGTDGALALAMLHVVIGEELFDRDFVKRHTRGFARLARHVRKFTPEWAAGITGLEPAAIREATRAYAGTRPASILWGNAVDMSACNFQTARSILMLMALTGNIDAPGGNALWVPPADVRQRSMFENPEVAGVTFLPFNKYKRAIGRKDFPLLATVHPPTFWESIISGDPYRLRALWIMGANPLLTMAPALRVEAALKELEFVVASDLFLTPTAQMADLVLPAATWLEQDDVCNLHKIWCVLARRKVAQVGESADDREVMLEMAHRLGLDAAFPWSGWRDYLDWVLEDTGMDFDAFAEKGILTGEMRYRKFEQDGFETRTGKCVLYSRQLKRMGVEPLPVYREPVPSPVSTPGLFSDYPLILTTGARVSCFFHSEGRQIGSLRRRNPDPLAEMHPATAAAAGVTDGDWIWIETPAGRVTLRASVTDAMSPGIVSAQHGWWYPEDEPPEHGWRRSNVNLLFESGPYDPDTGSQCLRSSLCRVYRVDK
ncbi:MAG: molybdopterin-containing oxidoreductase family protein [Candidatus Geothermincolia bacterium]